MDTVRKIHFSLILTSYLLITFSCKTEQYSNHAPYESNNEDEEHTLYDHNTEDIENDTPGEDLTDTLNNNYPNILDTDRNSNINIYDEPIDLDINENTSCIDTKINTSSPIHINSRYNSSYILIEKLQLETHEYEEGVIIEMTGDDPNEYIHLTIEKSPATLYGVDGDKIILNLNGRFFVSMFQCFDGKRIFIHDTNGNLIMEGGNIMCSCSGSACLPNVFSIGNETYSCNVQNDPLSECRIDYRYKTFTPNFPPISENEMLINDTVYYYEIHTAGHLTSTCDISFEYFIGSYIVGVKK